MDTIFSFPNVITPKCVECVWLTYRTWWRWFWRRRWGRGSASGRRRTTGTRRSHRWAWRWRWRGRRRLVAGWWAHRHGQGRCRRTHSRRFATRRFHQWSETPRRGRTRNTPCPPPSGRTPPRSVSCSRCRTRQTSLSGVLRLSIGFCLWDMKGERRELNFRSNSNNILLCWIFFLC